MRRRRATEPHRLFVVVTVSRLRLWAPVVALVLVTVAVMVAAPSRPATEPGTAPAVVAADR